MASGSCLYIPCRYNLCHAGSKARLMQLQWLHQPTYIKEEKRWTGRQVANLLYPLATNVGECHLVLPRLDASAGGVYGLRLEARPTKAGFKELWWMHQVNVTVIGGDRTHPPLPPSLARPPIVPSLSLPAVLALTPLCPPGCPLLPPLVPALCPVMSPLSPSCASLVPRCLPRPPPAPSVGPHCPPALSPICPLIVPVVSPLSPTIVPPTVPPLCPRCPPVAPP